MAHYGLLGTYQVGAAAEDIRGAALYGHDDKKLGTIKDVIFDHLSGDIGYIVVDTGGWLSSREFVVPADRVEASTGHENDFSTALTREQIEGFPRYETSDLDSPQRWNDYEGRYRAKWETGPVMHRAESDRNITPTTQQLEGNQNSIRAAEGRPEPIVSSQKIHPIDPGALHAASASTGRVVPAGVDSVVIENSAVGIGGRWDTFQARLRERRKEAASACPTCTGAASTRTESASTFKKAV
ncbi:MAG: PRC-barrel domain-containing protein [Terriglobales bacterium]